MNRVGGIVNHFMTDSLSLTIGNIQNGTTTDASMAGLQVARAMCSHNTSPSCTTAAHALVSPLEYTQLPERADIQNHVHAAPAAAAASPLAALNAPTSLPSAMSLAALGQAALSSPRVTTQPMAKACMCSQSLQRAHARGADPDRLPRQAASVIGRLADELKLKSNIKDRANELFATISPLKLTRGRGMEAVCSALLFVACAAERNPRESLMTSHCHTHGLMLFCLPMLT